MLFDERVVTAIRDALPYILSGIPVTLGLMACSMGLGLVLGVPMAVAQVYGGKTSRRLAGLYVWFFRGIPILVQLYIFYFGIFAWLANNFSVFKALGLDTAFVSASLVLGMTSTAYQSQIFRGAILSLPEGQLKAARALGMSDGKAIRTIILPQALRLSIPGWSNEYSILLKDSALAFVIGVIELMSRTKFVAAKTHIWLPLSIFAGILYFLLTWAGVKGLKMLQRKVRIPGYSQ